MWHWLDNKHLHTKGMYTVVIKGCGDIVFSYDSFTASTALKLPNANTQDTPEGVY